MQFVKGAEVFTAEDEKVGELERVVMDPQTDEVTHIVVEKGFIFKTAKVLPMALLNTVTPEKIVLDEGVKDLQSLPEFKQTHYVPKELQTPGQGTEDDEPVYWYPPIGTSWWRPSGYLGSPSAFGYPMPPFVAEQEKHIPEGTVALQEGAKVLDNKGEHIGDVERVYVSASDRRATHLLISQGFLLTEEKLVPTIWVRLVEPDAVHLAVNASLVEKLPEFQPLM